MQEGSKVDQDLLRFDFSHPGALSDAELLAIEDEVNRRILACDPVAAEEMPLTEARRLGATMLGEKYGDLVRVIRVGDYSMELCGGTHLDNTGQIGIFRIVDESSISAGTRVVAITGLRALEEFRKVTGLLERTANLLRVRTEDIPGRVDSLLKELRQLKKVAEAGGAASAVTAEALLAKAQTIEGAKLVVAELAEPNIPLMRQLIDQIRAQRRTCGNFPRCC